MRCPKCGFTNPENSIKCSECGSSFSEEIPTNIGEPAPSSSQPAREQSRTFMVTPTNLPAWDEGTDPQLQMDKKIAKGSHPTKCPYCQYIMVLESDTCPNCKRRLNAQNEPRGEAFVEPPVKREPTHEAPPVVPNPQNDVKGRGKSATIDPYRIAKRWTAWFHPVKKDLEHKMPEPCMVESDELPTRLNRALLDPNNNTITSKVQAEIEFRDGQWYLMDKSGQGTTFVRAGRQISLQKGDVILMGDRKFIFDC